MVDLPDLASAAFVAAGSAHSLAVSSAGQVFAWGANQYGQLGDHTTSAQSLPSTVRFPVRTEASAIGSGPAAVGSLALVEGRPTVASVSPGAGPTSGGTSVEITGSGFTALSNVYFGTEPAASVTVGSFTEIVAVSPPGPVGTVDVRVTNASGSSRTNHHDTFTYDAPSG